MATTTNETPPPPPPPPLPPPSPEHRRIAEERFKKAKGVIEGGDFSYGIALLLPCCKLDPANFQYRQTLRRTQKAKYPNKHGSSMAWLTTYGYRSKLKKAKRKREYLKVLEYGEEVLSRDPWDLEVQKEMGAAADALGLSDIAVFILDQARQKFPKDAPLNRQLARLFEKRGNFSHAITLWQLVKEVVPKDIEAQHKSKELAASETIQRGGYDSGEKPALSLNTGASGNGAKSAKKEEKPVDRVEREAAPLRAKIVTAPTDPNNYLQLAAIYRRYNHPDRARAALEQGLGPTGSHYSISLELMELDIEPFRKDLAVTEDKPRKSKKSSDAEDDAESTQGLQQIRAKLLAEISAREIELLRLKVDRYPLESTHRLELGLRLLQAGQVDSAVQELQSARKDQKSAGKASIYLGMCFLKMNNWRLAQRNFEEALTLLPGSDEESRKEVLFYLAKGHAAAGELPKAIELGHELANLDFSYKNINKLIDEWQEKLQDQ